MDNLIERLRAASTALCTEAADVIERLRDDCAEAYQVVGAAMLGEPCAYDDSDVERALDNLSAAANGTPRPHDDLLPWPREQGANASGKPTDAAGGRSA